VGLRLFFGEGAPLGEAFHAPANVELGPFEGVDGGVAGDHGVAGLGRQLDDAGPHRAGAEDAYTLLRSH
jgi:hypothetical protein